VHTPTCYELIPTWSKHFAKLKWLYIVIQG
jgi:hypothetical protein